MTMTYGVDPYTVYLSQAEKMRKAHDKDEARYHRELSVLGVSECGICKEKIE